MTYEVDPSENRSTYPSHDRLFPIRRRDFTNSVTVLWIYLARSMRTLFLPTRVKTCFLTLFGAMAMTQINFNEFHSCRNSKHCHHIVSNETDQLP